MHHHQFIHNWLHSDSVLVSSALNLSTLLLQRPDALKAIYGMRLFQVSSLSLKIFTVLSLLPVWLHFCSAVFWSSPAVFPSTCWQNLWLSYCLALLVLCPFMCSNCDCALIFSESDNMDSTTINLYFFIFFHR